jgi:hypothetical protein
MPIDPKLTNTPMAFVFGSNEAGRHGKGAAKYALEQKGAIYGLGQGPAGNSYALPTMDWKIRPLPAEVIQHYVNRFIVFARYHPSVTFQVTRVGCGLGGHYDKDIAPMFKYAPANCLFDEAWREHLPKKQFWGTFP